MKVVPAKSSAAASRTVNKAEAAAWFEVSVPTVDAWLRRGCPYVQRGDKGKSWQLDLLEVARWYLGGQPTDADEDPEKLPPKDRLDWYRGSRERTKHLEDCGQLMKVEDFERALSAALKTVAVTLESLPDVLERDAGLDGAAVERAQYVVDRMRNDLYARLNDGVIAEPAHA